MTTLNYLLLALFCLVALTENATVEDWNQNFQLEQTQVSDAWDTEGLNPIQGMVAENARN